MSLTYRSPHAATLLYRPESVFQFACCGLDDDVRCQLLGDFLLVNLALDNHADFRGGDDCSLLASDRNTKYEWVLQRISVCLFELILRNTINSLGLRIIENSSYFNSRQPTILFKFEFTCVWDETTNRKEPQLLLAAPFVEPSSGRSDRDKYILEEIFELPQVSMIFRGSGIPHVITSQNAGSNFLHCAAAIPKYILQLVHREVERAYR